MRESDSSGVMGGLEEDVDAGLGLELEWAQALDKRSLGQTLALVIVGLCVGLKPP